MTIETKENVFFIIVYLILHFARRPRWLRANGQTFVYITAIKCLIINHMNVQHVACIKHVIFIRIKWKFIDSRFMSSVRARKEIQIGQVVFVSRSWARFEVAHHRNMNKWIHNSWLRKQRRKVCRSVAGFLREDTELPSVCPFKFEAAWVGWKNYIKNSQRPKSSLKKVAERYMGLHVSYALLAARIRGFYDHRHHRMWQRQIQSNIYEYLKHVGGGTTQTARVY